MDGRSISGLHKRIERLELDDEHRMAISVLKNYHKLLKLCETLLGSNLQTVPELELANALSLLKGEPGDPTFEDAESCSQEKVRAAHVKGSLPGTCFLSPTLSSQLQSSRAQIPKSRIWIGASPSLGKKIWAETPLIFRAFLCHVLGDPLCLTTSGAEIYLEAEETLGK